MKNSILLLIFVFIIKITLSQEEPLHQLKGHTYTVSCVDFSPAGDYIATGSWDKTIKLWDIETGKLVRTLHGHLFAVFGINFSPNGKYIASASKDKMVILWDVETGEIVHTLSGHNSWVQAVCFSPDGKRLASVGYDNKINIWNTENGKLDKTLTGHTAEVVSVAFHPHKNILATGSADKTIKIWDLNTGTKKELLLGHEAAIWGLAFSPDGKNLVSGSQDGTVRKWSLENGQERFVFEQPEGWVNCVKYSPDGNFFMSSSYKKFSFWHSVSGEFIRSFPQDAGAVLCVDFSHNGNLIASTYRKTAKIWNIGDMVLSELRPQIVWEHKKIDMPIYANSNTYQLDVAFKSDSMIHKIDVFLNDSIVVSKNNQDPGKVKDSTVTLVVTLKLLDGENNIRIEVTNSAGKTSETKRIIYPKYYPKNTSKRLAVLVFNTNYTNSDISIPYDATLIEELKNILINKNFTVIVHKNRKLNDLNEIAENFVASQTDYSDFLFYYSGLSTQYGGKNYIIPNDAKLNSSQQITKECMPLKTFTHSIDDKNKTKIFVLDACYKNPFEDKWRVRHSEKGLCYFNPAINSLLICADLPGREHDISLSNTIFTKLFVKYSKNSDNIHEILQNLSNEMQQKSEQMPIQFNTLLQNITF